MSQSTFDYLICDVCGGVIPHAADRIHSNGGLLVFGGTDTSFDGADFCSTEHFLTWLGYQPNVPTPDPLYAPPPAA